MTWAQVVADFQKPIKSMYSPGGKTHKRCLACEKLLTVDNFYSKGEGNQLFSRCKPCYKVHKKRRKQ